jgi:hypothetical protein
MPADLDQFGGEDSHGAVIGGKGLVQLGHVAPDARGFLHQINPETRRGQVQRGLDTADSATDNQDIADMFVGEIFTKLFHLFFFHFSIPFNWLSALSFQPSAFSF